MIDDRQAGANSGFCTAALCSDKTTGQVHIHLTALTEGNSKAQSQRQD